MIINEEMEKSITTYFVPEIISD